MNWKYTVGQSLRHMTPEQAASAILRIRQRIGDPDQPQVRRLTGGFAGGVVTTYVLQKLAAVARNAKESQ